MLASSADAFARARSVNLTVPPAGRSTPSAAAPRPFHRLDHARHLLTRHPGDAGGGGAERGAGAGGGI